MANGKSDLLAQFSPIFVKFLMDTPQALAKLLDIAIEWYKLQQNPSFPQPTSGGGPQHFEIGGTNPLQTAGLTDAYLEAIAKGYAEATVKEKAIEFLKGFLSGVMFAAGGAA